MLLEIPKIENIDFEGGFAKIKINTFNERIRILSFNGDIEALMDKLLSLAKDIKIGKIFYVGTKEEIDIFKKQGFIMEAKVNNLLNGNPGYFLSKFLISERKRSMMIPEEEEVLIRSREYISEEYEYHNYDNYIIKNASENDAGQLASLYDSVFQTYPSPMNDSEYIKYAMRNNVFFKVAVYQDKIVSTASADLDPKYLNAEMTDCATYKLHRGHGLMGRLIFELEKEMRSKKYKVFYSTARSISIGMNIVFAKHNYEYGGRLVNHCHICGQFENMNVWIKVL